MLRSISKLATFKTPFRSFRSMSTNPSPFETLTEMLDVSVKKYGDKTFLGSRNPEGKFNWTSYKVCFSFQFFFFEFFIFNILFEFF